MGFLQKLFGGGSSMPAASVRKILLKACDLIHDAKVAGPSLRRVIADAIGAGTGPESHLVTAVVNEVKTYGGLPSGVEPSLWWDNAGKEARMKLLSDTAQCLQ